MPTYTPDETKGSQLINESGTFYTKYYPYRNVIKDLCRGFEVNAEQLEQTATEIYNSAVYKDCPLEALQVWENIALDTSDTYVKVNGINPFTGQRYKIGEGTKIGFSGFKLPEGILSIGTITDSISNPSYTLYQNKDYYITQGVIYFKHLPDQEVVWGHNVKYKASYIYDSFGFAFLEKEDTQKDFAREILILLYHMIRYGIRESKLCSFLNLFFGYPVSSSEGEVVLEVTPEKIVTDIQIYKVPSRVLPIVKKDTTLSYLQPLTNAVNIVPAHQTQFYRFTDQTFFRDPKVFENKWGSQIKWGQKTLKWGDRYSTQDPFYENLQDRIIYVAQVQLSDQYFPLKYLQFIQQAKPIWMALDIQVYRTWTESYEEQQDEAEIFDCILSQENYGYAQDGIETVIQWGLDTEWGDGSTWGQIKLQPTVRILRRPIL